MSHGKVTSLIDQHSSHYREAHSTLTLKDLPPNISQHCVDLLSCHTPTYSIRQYLQNEGYSVTIQFVANLKRKYTRGQNQLVSSVISSSLHNAPAWDNLSICSSNFKRKRNLSWSFSRYEPRTNPSGLLKQDHYRQGSWPTSSLQP